LNYKNIDLTQSATKDYADISAFSAELGDLANNMKSQQILKLLNQQVILNGLKQLNGLNDTLDKKVDMLLLRVEDALEKKKTPFLKIFFLHILFFVILFLVTVQINPESANVGYALASVGMGCATGVLNLMLRVERKKYNINNVFLVLEEEGIENFFKLHKKLANTIDTFRKENKIDEVEKLDATLKNIISGFVK
jgi:hypothetical protein